MNRGGIFNGPTALGIPEQGVFHNAALGATILNTSGKIHPGMSHKVICAASGLEGLGATEIPSCDFASNKKTDAALAVQNAMIVMGATLIKPDGLWGSCSESAFQKLTGEPLSGPAMEKNFGIKCGVFNKLGIFDPSKCTNGTDAITVYEKPPTPGNGIGPTTTTPPGGASIWTGILQPFTRARAVKPSVVLSKTPVYISPEELERRARWISLLPNWAVVLGGVAVVGSVAAYMILREPKPTTALANRRRRHHRHGRIRVRRNAW